MTASSCFPLPLLPSSAPQTLHVTPMRRVACRIQQHAVEGGSSYPPGGEYAGSSHTCDVCTGPATWTSRDCYLLLLFLPAAPTGCLVLSASEEVSYGTDGFPEGCVF